VLRDWAKGGVSCQLDNVDSDSRVIGDGESTFATSHGQMTDESHNFPQVRKGMRSSPPKPSSTKNVFYVDSGAGQCLSSCSTAFVTLEPCALEVVGVAGSLPIFVVARKSCSAFIIACTALESSISLAFRKCKRLKGIL
jgi:hypothetical protein